MPFAFCLLPFALGRSAIFPCLDAVAHGGNPQDRAASLFAIIYP
ncbi:hypothetical protein [Moorena sp. SIO4G3]|nr:hypothetical protein [Moorena sp. SIO4G3]